MWLQTCELPCGTVTDSVLKSRLLNKYICCLESPLEYKLIAQQVNVSESSDLSLVSTIKSSSKGIRAELTEVQRDL